MGARRTDNNHAEVIAALRGLGCSVWDTHESGHGSPDCVVYVNELATLLVEIKAAKGRLTKDEAAWHARWRGQVYIVSSVDEAIALVRRVREGGC